MILLKLYLFLPVKMISKTMFYGELFVFYHTTNPESRFPYKVPKQEIVLLMSEAHR